MEASCLKCKSQILEIPNNGIWSKQYIYLYCAQCELLYWYSLNTGKWVNGFVDDVHKMSKRTMKKSDIGRKDYEYIENSCLCQTKW